MGRVGGGEDGKRKDGEVGSGEAGDGEVTSRCTEGVSGDSIMGRGCTLGAAVGWLCGACL